jgi:hypothetical protein
MSALVNTELRSSLTVPVIVPFPVWAVAGVSQSTLHKMVAKKSERRVLRITLPQFSFFGLRLFAEGHDAGRPLPGLCVFTRTA